MRIESYTYFENLDMSCQIAFGFQSEGEELLNNPPFISVDNWFSETNEGDVLYVANSHEYDLPEKQSYHSAGFWRVKYKS